MMREGKEETTGKRRDGQPSVDRESHSEEKEARASTTTRYVTLSQGRGMVFVRSLGKKKTGASGKDGSQDIICLEG